MSNFRERKKAKDYKMEEIVYCEGETWEVEGFWGDEILLLKKLNDTGTDYERKQYNIGTQKPKTEGVN